MDIKKYDVVYNNIIKEYLLKITNSNNYNYYKTPEQIMFFAFKKNLFLIIEDNKIINIFYEDKQKKHARFLFEYPKKEYEFLEKYDYVCASFLSEEEIDKDKRYCYYVDIILDNKKVIELKGQEFKNIRQKIKQVSKYNIEILNKENKPLKQEIYDFLEKWLKQAKERQKIKPSIEKDKWWVDYIYDNDTEIQAIIVKDKDTNKIIGFCLYQLSLLKDYAISLATKRLNYKGLSEYLYYLKCKEQYEKYNIRYQNIANITGQKMAMYKLKFSGVKQKVCFSIIKSKDKKEYDFWINDHYSVDK